VIRSGAVAAPAAVADGTPAILVMLNKVERPHTLVDAVPASGRRPGPARFHILVPNPDHVGFDRNDPDTISGEGLLARALAQLHGVENAAVSGRVANSPNAYDDIVEELQNGALRGNQSLETPPSQHLALAARRPAPPGSASSAIPPRRSPAAA